MTTHPKWQRDESIPINKDFGNREVVRAYDEWHGRLRDIEGENAAILAWLDLKPGEIVADIGCGTGAFARCAARHCGTVHAIDISTAMLDFVRWKVQEEGLDNVVCRQGSLLTYVHEGPPFDAMHTSMALHHLPDFWKQKALNRLAAILKPGGRFHLMDVVFQEGDVDAHIDAWIAQMEVRGGIEARESFQGHIRKEYSTFTWIMEGLLERAGFRIERAEHSAGVIAHYYCTKIQGEKGK